MDFSFNSKAFEFRFMKIELFMLRNKNILNLFKSDLVHFIEDRKFD